jgi:hypothetical protein
MGATTISILAILLSPVIAVGVTLWSQRRKDRRDGKLWILNTLMQTRHHGPASDEKVRALNMIDVVFRKAPKVRGLWHEYFDMVNNAGMNNPLGHDQWNRRYLEMLAAMAKDVGYGQEITALDIDRVYSPVGFGKFNERSEAISDELLRVLKGSQGLSVTPVHVSTTPPRVEPPKLSSGEKQ